MAVELLISGAENKVYMPAVLDGIEWMTKRRSTPGKLTFKVLKDDVINFSEGAAVRLKVDGKNVFYGFVFTKSRDKEPVISVTAYDQIRYLKNKDTYVYENKTASQFIKMIADDFHLNVGTIEDTGHIIASRVEEDAELLDMIENALDITLQSKKAMYVLYDDFGKLTLKNISSMYVADGDKYLLIDESTGQNYDYTTSIDSNTYNKIKLATTVGKREVYIAQDTSNINEWGVLQYYGTLSQGENGKAKADALLELYNKKTRKLQIKDAYGDVRVRAGSLVAVRLNLGDTIVNNFMLVESATHKFSNDAHFMDLTLRGGEFVG